MSQYIQPSFAFVTPGELMAAAIALPLVCSLGGFALLHAAYTETAHWSGGLDICESGGLDICDSDARLHPYFDVSSRY
jgi:hypothetical protein